MDWVGEMVLTCVTFLILWMNLVAGVINESSFVNLYKRKRALLLIRRFIISQLAPELVESCILRGMLAHSAMPCGTVPWGFGTRASLDAIIVIRFALLPSFCRIKKISSSRKDCFL
jgi:hypothetical protein